MKSYIPELFTDAKGKLTETSRRLIASLSGSVVGTNGQIVTVVDGALVAASVASILPQRVNDTETTPATNATSTYAATGLSAAITLTAITSRVRVRAIVNGLLKTTGDTGIAVRIRRSATTWPLSANAGKTGTATDNRPGSVVGEVVETPGTVGPHTYVVEFASAANVAGVMVQEGNAQSSLTLEEEFA